MRMQTRRRGSPEENGDTRPDAAPSKDVELCLEVEIDDEVKELIKSPERCRSALLDVTVIKPAGLDGRATERQTLKSGQVKKLIDSMNLAGDDKRDLLEEIFGEARGSSAKNKFTWIRGSGGRLDRGDVARGASRRLPKRREQVYTTARTVEAVRSIFACKNKRGGDGDDDDDGDGTRKADGPCLCRNCAVVGILADAQKRPFVTEPMPEPTAAQASRRSQRKKSVGNAAARPHPPRTAFEPQVSFGPADEPHQECRFLFERLATKIGELERRVRAQDERAVPKDYFRKIITKLVNHLTKLTSFATEERKEEGRDRRPRYHHHVHPLLVAEDARVPAEKEYEPRPCCSTTADPGVWRWGGEILRPGVDLKNKIADLLEDTFRGVRRGWEKDASDAPRPGRGDASFDVAYVNPASGAWEESQISFRAVSSGACEKQSGRGRRGEFLRVIENATTADKFRLWQSIWNRALANGQSRDDAVTVEVRRGASSARARFTVGEMERLLGARGRRK